MEEISLKGVFSKLKASEDLSATLPLLSYLGITYKKNEVVKDVLDWFEYGIDFLNYGNPIEELRMAVSNSEDVKQLMILPVSLTPSHSHPPNALYTHRFCHFHPQLHENPRYPDPFPKL